MDCLLELGRDASHRAGLFGASRGTFVPSMGVEHIERRRSCSPHTGFHGIRYGRPAFMGTNLSLNSEVQQYFQPVQELHLPDAAGTQLGRGDRCPEHFDLVAIIENRGELPVGPIELGLTGDRKIGEFCDFCSQPYPWDVAVWEGPVDVESRNVEVLDANSTTSVLFGPFSVDQLWQDLTRSRDLWPWEARYEVTLVCAGCSPMTASASFDLTHPH